LDYAPSFEQREVDSSALREEGGETMDYERPGPLEEEDDDENEPSSYDAPPGRFAERILPEILKRIFESGVGKIAEGPENLRHFVSELRLPKEIAAYLLSQIDETKSGLYRAVAKEIGGFLQQTNLAEELIKALSKLSLEIKTEIHFSPREPAHRGASNRPRPEVRASVNVKSDRPSEG
jgi:hypothetical protein